MRIALVQVYLKTKCYSHFCYCRRQRLFSHQPREKRSFSLKSFNPPKGGFSSSQFGIVCKQPLLSRAASVGQLFFRKGAVLCVYSQSEAEYVDFGALGTLSKYLKPVSASSSLIDIISAASGLCPLLISWQIVNAAHWSSEAEQSCTRLPLLPFFVRSRA